MRKNAKQKLIDFMKYKDQMIRKCLGSDKIEYFNEEDALAIRNWTDKICQSIVRKLKTFLIDMDCSDAELCPFCIRHIAVLGCDSCEYGKLHKNCNNDDSTYVQLDELIMETYGNGIGCTMFYIIKKTRSRKKLLNILERGLQDEE